MRKILVIDDDLGALALYSSLLEEPGRTVRTAESLASALNVLRSEEIEVVVSDVHLGMENGLTLVNDFYSNPVKNTFASKHPRFIFVTGYPEVESAVHAIHHGAVAYLPKQTDLSEMEKSLKQAVSKALRLCEKSAVSGEVERLEQSNYSEAPLFGRSQKISALFEAIARASMNSLNVLINGETGVGKEIVARLIHQKSDRSKKKFVAVNCGAMTETLLESELFGHERGAFTGAVAARKGLFEEADGGTLFLDEVGDISPALQVQLLRAIQEREVRAIGSSQFRKVDVRFIAATHRDLKQMVADGKFRQDLYYRLKVLEISVPGLRDRLDDLSDLVHYFVERANEKCQRKIRYIEKAALRKLRAYNWPGNVRELENVIQRAVSVATTDTLTDENFPAELFIAGPPTPVEDVADEAQDTARQLPTLKELEASHIRKVLERCKNNKSKAAEILGIDRVTLYRKLQQLEIRDIESVA